jgi:CRISPR system Cascade subunit CasB
MSSPQAEDYIKLFNDYKELSNGDQASIKREVEPNDLHINPVFYRLINKTVFKDKLNQVTRIIYFLPFLNHQPQGKTLGALLQNKKFSERRLFLVMRSESPQDLIHLRRLCQQIKGEKLDGVKLGQLLFYWGKDKKTSEKSKRQLMQDFYLSNPDTTTKKQETA